MRKSNSTRNWKALLLVVAMCWQGGCEQDQMTEMTADKPTGAERQVTSPIGGEIESADLAPSEFWSPVRPATRMMALAEECCTTTGHADECWEQDARADDVTGNIFCNSDADCGGGTCNTGPAIQAVLGNYDGLGDDFSGMCECSADEDCRDISGNGGACFRFGNDGTGTAVSLCGPSMCNGYYVCSCWGGCVWWDPDNALKTPAMVAESINLNCCENASYSDPRIESGILLYGDSNCNYECSVDADCDPPSIQDPNMDDSCVVVSCNEATNECEYKPLTGIECDLDGLSCTVDRCTSAGACSYSGLRCGPEATYFDENGDEQPNSCVETCREDPTDTDGNGDLWECNVNLAIPSDVSLDPNGICDWWACEANGSGVNEPVHHVQDCVAESDDSFCFDYTCDSSPPHLQGNCDTISSSVTRANDTCAAAQSIGSFVTADGDGARLTEYGDTRCAQNDHNAGVSADCNAETYTSRSLGYGFNNSTGTGGRDLVYSFTYEPSGSDTADYRYVVQLEGIYNNNGEFYDPAVYLSTSCDSASTAVAAEACEISSGTRIDEDECDDCTSQEGSTAYDPGPSGAYYAKSDIYEVTGSTAPVTVYVYVDADDTVSGGGEFFLSVIKENVNIGGCPTPFDDDFFYKGPIHRVVKDGTYDYAIPINGTDFFPIPPSEQVQVGTLGTVTGIVVTGSTATMYDGVPPGDYYEDPADLYAFNGYDQLWEVELDAGVENVVLGASVCDYGGSFNDTPHAISGNQFDPMLAIFDCHGNRLDVNDNSGECDGTGAQIRPSSPMSASIGQYYYILVDGRYQGPGSGSGGVGSRTGDDYELSVFYNPVTDTTCEPGGADAGLGISLTLPSGGNEPEVPPWDSTSPDNLFFENGCVLLENGLGDWKCDTITFFTNNVGPADGSPQKCYPGSGDDQWSFCMDPMIVKYTMYYSSSTVAGKTCTYSDWLTSRDGHFNDLGTDSYFRLYDVHPKDPECDIFESTAIGFMYNPNLSAAQLATCLDKCSYMTSMYIRHPSMVCP